MSGGTPPRREQTADPQINRLQVGLEQATQQSRNSPLVAGQLLANVTVPGSGFVDLPHKLGKAWTGWFAVDVSNGSSVGSLTRPTGGSAQSRASLSTTLRLSVTSGMAWTGSIWIF